MARELASPPFEGVYNRACTTRLSEKETSRSSPPAGGESPILTRSVSEVYRKSLAARAQRPRSRFGLVYSDGSLHRTCVGECRVSWWYSGEDCRTRGRNIHLGHGGFGHVLPLTTLLVDRTGCLGFSTSFSAAGNGAGPLQFRCDPGSAVRFEQRCRDPGSSSRLGVLDHPLAASGVLSASLGQVRQQPTELDVSTCFAPLLAWILKGWPSTRLALALDATSLGDRFTILSISVVYRGSAIPVAWKVLPANVRHAWKPEWISLVRSFRALVPPEWTVIVMTDRGLYARWLFQEIITLGWHPLMRINHQSKFRKNRLGSSVPVKALVSKVGRRWQGRGVAFPRRPESRLDCTLLACWEAGHDEPWFVLTDLGPEQSDGLWYGMRAWIEQGFKLLKHGGWQWQETRMTDPERANRLWLVLAVATRYLLAVGGESESAEMTVETIPEMVPAKPDCRASGRRTDSYGRSAPARRPIKNAIPTSRSPDLARSHSKNGLPSAI